MSNSKKQLQAIFFDFDGVIIDSTGVKIEGFKALFQDYPPEVISQIVDYHILHGGISRVEKIRYAHEHILGVPLTEKELDIWASRYSELVFEKVIEVDWIAGAIDFLENVPDHVRVFVISGTPEWELKMVIENRQIGGYFDKILGSPILKTAHIKSLLQQYRLVPENCVFIGDALTDYHAARETGLFFIGIQGEVTFPDGTVILPDCTDLREVIGYRFLF